MADAFGHEEGERCWRNGCQGAISIDPDDEMDCSCHINPPCSRCSTDWTHCDECGWKPENDIKFTYKQVAPGLAERILVKPRALDPRKIDWRTKSHSSSSMKREGVYPPGTTQAEVKKLVNGTFGGRFSSFGNGRFTFIAYTD